MINLEVKIDKNEFIKKLGIKDGRTPVKGIDYFDGTPGDNGSPDSPDEVVGKVNEADKKIEPKQIKGLLNVFKAVDDYGSNMGVGVGGGGITIRYLSNGVLVSAYVTELNFSTNITPTYDGNGRITLTASGGGGTTYTETPSGLINGVNVTYTTAHTITTILNFSINGQFIHPAEYSVVGSTITFITPLDSSLSGKGFTIIYQ